MQLTQSFGLPWYVLLEATELSGLALLMCLAIVRKNTQAVELN